MKLQDILLVLKKRFWLILAGALIAGVVALVLSLVWPPTYEAQALILITKLRSQVTLDPRYQTVTEENVVNLSVQEEQVRRQTLVGLAKSSDLIQHVIDRLGNTLSPDERSVSTVEGMVDVGTDGNLITISAKARTPQKATAIANTWSDVYQENVNSLYSATSPSDTQVQEQLQASQSSYDAAKAALEAFLQQSQENELTRQIDQKQQILADLQAAHLAAVRQRTAALLARLGRTDRLMLDIQSLQGQLASLPASDPLTAGEQYGLFSLEAASITQGEGLTSTLEIAAGWPGDGNLSVGQAKDHLDHLLGTLKTTTADTQAEVDSLSSDLLSGRELVTDGSGDTSAASIEKLQAEINGLQSQLETVQSMKKDLTSTRDVAQQNLVTLQRKAAEVQILSQSTDVEVQKAASAQLPEEPAFPRPLLTTALAVIAGGLAGLALCFVLELWPRDEKKPATA